MVKVLFYFFDKIGTMTLKGGHSKKSRSPSGVSLFLLFTIKTLKIWLIKKAKQLQISENRLSSLREPPGGNLIYRNQGISSPK